MKKARTAGKSEIGDGGKNAKVGSSFPTGGRLLSVSTGKGITSPSYKTAKTHKSSTFGVIWVPRRKLNKYYKNTVYDSHRNDRSYDRSPSMYNYMSGDSSTQQALLKKKDDESDSLMIERSGKSSLAAASTVEAVASTERPPDIIGSSSEEKQEQIKLDKDDHNDAAGDTEKKKDENKYYDSEKENKSQPVMEKDKGMTEKEKLGDNVDSVFLRSPLPHKTHSSASTPEEEDCGIKCLYYTLQCCDCNLM